ncbi:MAG: PKD domain-containing protein [bacterium]
MKETINKKTVWEKIKESFTSALISAGIVLIVLLLIYIPFKIIPAIYGNGSRFVATTLYSLLIPGDVSSTSTSISENINSNASSTLKQNKNDIINNNDKLTEKSKVNYKSVPNYYGKSDLQITLIGTGIIDSASKQFMLTNYAGYNDEIAIKFEVKNIGTNISGEWKLRINTPSKTTPYYDSPYQVSIRPGDKIIFTTSFNSPINTGINTAYITADPLNMINEYLENNNLLIVPIKIEGTFYSYNNNYNYGNKAVISNLPYGSLYTWTNLNVNCYANPQTSYIGSPITWYATVSGGNGYYSYSWAGSDLLNSNESAITKTYYSSGNKTASITVISNGVSVTKQCNAYVN